MFTALLKDHPMEELLTDGLPMRVPSAEDRPAWDGVREPHRQAILRRHRIWANKPYPMRTASGFLAFSRSGSRQADEMPYFFRRRKLCVAALAECLAPSGKVPDEVIDGIWAILEESSWVISAHNINPIPGAPKPSEKPLPDPEDPYVDLFSAQTGMILAIIRRMLGKEMDAVTPLIGERISRDIRGRILEPFLRRDDFWWMGVKRKDLNNWTPWIVSNVLLIAGLEPLERGEKARILERACAMLDRWLDTVPDDGGCDEGAGYWNMAGGALLDCLEALEGMTGGALSFRKEEKIRRVLTFPRKMEIGRGWFLNFADCDARPFLSRERVEAAGLYAEDAGMVALGRKLRDAPLAELDDVPHLSRVLKALFRPQGGLIKSKAETDTWLPDLQVRLVRRGAWSLGCKGGNNGENHNHNDVGSLILFRASDPVLVDAGNAVYTAKSFSDERYTLWHTRSAWHNLPLIGDAEQAPGLSHGARDVQMLPDGMEMELAEAYPDSAGLVSFHRRAELSEEGLRVTDRIETREKMPVTWVWMVRKKPETRNRVLIFGGTELALPEDGQVRVEEIPITDARMARNYPGSLWRILIRTPAAREQTREWVFRRKRERED